MRYSLEQRIFLYDTYVKYCINIASLFTCLISIIFVFRSSCFFGTGEYGKRSAGLPARAQREAACPAAVSTVLSGVVIKETPCTSKKN